jgi:hypothetical protein
VVRRKSRRLGESELIGAERKQRREPERKDGPAPIELGQDTKQLDEQAAFVRADFEEPRGEGVVWKVCQDQHDFVVLPGFPTSPRASGCLDSDDLEEGACADPRLPRGR